MLLFSAIRLWGAFPKVSARSASNKGPDWSFLQETCFFHCKGRYGCVFKHCFVWCFLVGFEDARVYVYDDIVPAICSCQIIPLSIAFLRISFYNSSSKI